MVKLSYIADLEFEDLSNPIAIGDGHFLLTVPYDGEILGDASGPVITGFILAVGSGADGTSVQIRNVTQGRDYFTTEPQFRVADDDGSGRAPLYGGVLCTKPTFRAGDVLALDVDGLPGNADSAQLYVWLTCEFWREVD